MAYAFTPGAMYRMPTHFGPATGPRRGPDGNSLEWKGRPQRTTMSVSFVTHAPSLTALLPPRFTLDGEPVVTVSATYLTDLPWLAGRGYNMLGVSFPAVFEGETDRMAGHFLAVLWENLAEPIITGREELGYSKIFCDLPAPEVVDGRTRCSGSWQGFEFIALELSDMVAAEPTLPSNPKLHYKYVPRTGAWGEADAAYAVMTPAGDSHEVATHAWRGTGRVDFRRARWEDMPTQYMIVNALVDLEVLSWGAATISRSIGGKDLSDQRILR